MYLGYVEERPLSGFGFVSTGAGGSGGGSGGNSDNSGDTGVLGSAVGAGLSIASGLVAAFVARNQKHNAQKVAATNAVNELGQALEKNLTAYLASDRFYSQQQYALQTFDEGWDWLTSPNGCGNAELGSAGQRCIDERKRGGVAPWCPTGTGCDFFATLRDPIANDPAVKPDPPVRSVFSSQISLPGGLEVSPLVLVGAALVAWGISKS